MRIETHQSGAVFNAKLADRMTFADHGPFRSLLEAVTKSGAQHCHIDISDLGSIDSAGLGMFVVAQQEAQRSGWSLVLKGARGHVKQLLELARFDRLITLAP